MAGERGDRQGQIDAYNREDSDAFVNTMYQELQDALEVLGLSEHDVHAE